MRDTGTVQGPATDQGARPRGGTASGWYWSGASGAGAVPDPDWDVRTWSEQTESIPPRTLLTERARYEAFRRLGEEARSTAEVANAFSVAWDTAWATFEDHAVPAVEDPQRIGACRRWPSTRQC